MGDNSYPYSTFIKPPYKLGASPKGTTEALKKDVKALGDYVDVLMVGTSRAQTVKGPLGNKYFLSTNTDCNDINGIAHPRYIYINNIPDTTFLGPDYRGLVFGILQDVSYINPSKLFSAFTQSDICREVTMETRDINNVTATETQYVLDDDLAGYPASWFPKGVHPIKTGQNSILAAAGLTALTQPDKDDPETQESGGKKGKNDKKDKKKGKNDKKDKKKGKKENFTTETEDTPLYEFVYYVLLLLVVIYMIVKLFQKIGWIIKLKQVFKRKTFV